LLEEMLLADRESVEQAADGVETGVGLMCGLNVLINGTAQQILDMNAAISFRGVRSRIMRPFNSKTVRFGHVRLPIQGLSIDDDQPFRTRRHETMFVGELFNFREVDPDATCDTKVLADLLESDSTTWRMIGRMFDGFYAIAIYDVVTGTTSIVTDGLAKKPLYIRSNGDGPVGISSQIKPLLCLGPVTWDETYLAAVRKWGYCPDQSTPFNEITKVPPFMSMVFDGDGKCLQACAYDKYEPNHKIDLAHALETAVVNRLVSDVPVSVLLSGGLDSTIVYQLASMHSNNLTAFHVANDEVQFLEHLHFGRNVKRMMLTTDEEDIDAAIVANETPVDLGSMQPQYALGRAIKRAGFQVAISGDGADELFGGYRRAAEYDSQWSDVFHELIHYHCPRLDRLMMNATVELRCPFLSRPVIEHALSLPWEVRMAKEYLKTTFADIVPAAILDREKKPLKARAIIDDKMAYRFDIVDRFKRLFSEYIAG